MDHFEFCKKLEDGKNECFRSEKKKSIVPEIRHLAAISGFFETKVDLPL